MQQNSYFKRLNIDEYVDKAINNILDLNLKMVEKETIDLTKLKQLKILFVNELENVCVGAGIITNKKRKFNFEEMSDPEKTLHEAIRKYYKETTNVTGGALNNMVDALIREAVEGGYKNKIFVAQEKLIQEAKQQGKPNDWWEIQLANYKVQLILKQIKAKNPETLEVDVD